MQGWGVWEVEQELVLIVGCDGCAKPCRGTGSSDKVSGINQDTVLLYGKKSLACPSMPCVFSPQLSCYADYHWVSREVKMVVM